MSSNMLIFPLQNFKNLRLRIPSKARLLIDNSPMLDISNVIPMTDPVPYQILQRTSNQIVIIKKKI